MIINIKNLKLKLPDHVCELKLLDLDEFFKSNRKHGDIFVSFKINDLRIGVIVEDTGRPEPKDFERLVSDVEELRRRGMLKHDMIIIKIIHHRGIHKGKMLIRHLAKSFKVELQECESVIDIEYILRKRHLL